MTCRAAINKTTIEKFVNQQSRAMEKSSLKKTTRPTCIVTFDCTMALSEVTRLSRQYKELEKIVNSLEKCTKQSDDKEEMTKLREDHSKMQKEYANYLSEKQSLYKKYNEEKNKLTTIEQQLKISQEKYVNLMIEKNNLKKKNTNENEKVKNESYSIKQKISELDGIIKQLEIKVDKNKSERVAILKQIKQKQIDLVNVKRESIELKNENKSLNRRLTQLKINKSIGNSSFTSPSPSKSTSIIVTDDKVILQKEQYEKMKLRIESNKETKQDNYIEIIQQIKKLKKENKLLEMENEVGIKYLSGISLK